MLAKEGDWVEIRRKPPNLKEFRGTLEAATESFLVFKGQTKIGMIPADFFKKHEKSKLKNKCKITKMDQTTSIIFIELVKIENVI
jgi:hypothetical protein